MIIVHRVNYGLVSICRVHQLKSFLLLTLLNSLIVSITDHYVKVILS